MRTCGSVDEGGGEGVCCVRARAMVTLLMLSAFICRFRVPFVSVTFSTTVLLLMDVFRFAFEFEMFMK
jgi:hypothetical protein